MFAVYSDNDTRKDRKVRLMQSSVYNPGYLRAIRVCKFNYSNSRRNKDVNFGCCDYTNWNSTVDGTCK